MNYINFLSKSFFFIACLSWCISNYSIAFGQVKYVKTISSGTGDGSSWANASSNLQAMIQATPAGGQVWVQAGTYYPNTKPYSGASPITTSDPRDVTFHIKDNVTLYGGFAGTETAINQRNIALNETILSGDIGVVGDSTDNAYHVILLVQSAFAIQDGVIDGFTIKDGNANGTGSVNTILYPTLRNYGGGIYTSYANGIIKNCKITACASSGGGAVYFSRSTINADFFKVYNNRTAGKGAAVHVAADQTYSTLTINHADFFNNNSSAEGGAFYMNYGSLIMDNSNFYNNLSGGSGSGLWGSYNSITIYNCQFYQNQGTSGALYLFQGVGTVSVCSFNNNQGGGVSLSNNLTGDMLLENNEFFGNSANNGAALSFNGGKTTIRRNYFHDNSASTRGGAIYFIPNTQPTSSTNNCSVVEQNIFENNQTLFISNLNGGYGGAWFSQNGDHHMINNLFVSNYANRGGAMYGQGARFKLENNTFYGNSANYDGGALALNADVDTLINNIFSANTKGVNNVNSDIEQTQAGVNVAFFHNALQQPNMASYPFSTANSGNVFQENPLFVDVNDLNGLDNMYFTEDDGLNLQKCSPLIDSGIVVSSGNTDITGDIRVQQASIDLGAYETSYANSVPRNVNLTGGGAYCQGGNGLVLDVINPETGVVYYLMLDGVVTGDSIGNSAALDFGLQTAVGNYTVIAENISSTCTKEMDTTLNIVVNNLPSVEIVLTPNTICAGQPIALTASGASTYHWSDTSVQSGLPFVPIDGASYILDGTDLNGCVNSDTLIINTLPLPDNGVSANQITLTAALSGGAYQWINCTTGQWLVNETNQVFVADQNGTYAVIVNDGNCSDTSDCVVVSVVGLETLNQELFSISPNPVMNNLIVQWVESKGVLVLFDHQGRMLQQVELEGNLVLDLSHLTSGMYHLQLYSDSGVYEKRFIKQ
jgi:hypothetical protein